MAAVGLLAQPVGAFSAGVEAKDSRGRSVNRWHWHRDAWPRVPKTVCRSSQLASLAATTEIAGCVAVMRTSVPLGWACPQVLTGRRPRPGRHAAPERAPSDPSAVTSLVAGLT